MSKGEKCDALVSVVVPVYNSQATIAACVDSVLAQNFAAVQVVLVNDGSSDSSGSICDAYAAADERVVVLHQQNRGRTAARYAGVSATTADWVTFVDSDDTLPLTAIASLYAAVVDSVDIVLGNGCSLPNEARTLIPIEDFRHKAVRGDGTIGVPWGALYRRALLTDYLFDLPREIYMGEDYIFWLRLVFSSTKSVAVVYENVYCKGADTTCSAFVWSADYAFEINELRKSAIPVDLHPVYMNDMLDDRLCNLMAVVLQQPASKWKDSRFYLDLVADMAAVGRKFSFKQRLFCSIPSLRLKRWLAALAARL